MDEFSAREVAGPTHTRGLGRATIDQGDGSGLAQTVGGFPDDQGLAFVIQNGLRGIADEVRQALMM